MSRAPSLQRLVDRVRGEGGHTFGPQTPEERLLYGIVLALPATWLLGLSELIWPLLTLPLLLGLLLKQRWQLPRFFLLWGLFLGLALASMFAQLIRLEGIWWLASGYISATIMFLYVFNTDTDEVSDRALVEIVALFWLVVAVTGLIGVVTRDAELPSVAEAVLPGALADEEWVQALITPRLADSNRPPSETGGVFDEPDSSWADFRPTGFLPWANHWGSAYAAALPAVLLLLYRPLTNRQRAWILAALVASLLPFILSRNRWVWTTLPVVAIYAMFRFWRPNRRIAIGILGLLLVSVAVVWTTPLGGVLTERVESEGSEAYRGELYIQGLEKIQESPLLGFGETIQVPSDRQEELNTLGADSQIIHSLIVHGVPALLLFVAFLVVGMVVTRRLETSLEAIAHFMLLTLILHSAFYLIVPTHRLHILMLAVAGAARYRYVTYGSFRYRPVTLYQGRSERERLTRSYRKSLS